MTQKNQFLIKKCEDVGTKHFSGFKAFIEYLNYMDDIYKNIEEHNPNKKHKILIFLMIWLIKCLAIKNLI